MARQGKSDLSRFLVILLAQVGLIGSAALLYFVFSAMDRGGNPPPDAGRAGKTTVEIRPASEPADERPRGPSQPGKRSEPSPPDRPRQGPVEPRPAPVAQPAEPATAPEPDPDPVCGQEQR